MSRTLNRNTFGPVFDADNHYWEARDAFTRHRDPKFRDRGLQVKEVDGVLRYVIGGKPNPIPPGPGDVHPRPSPGSFLQFFAGRVKANEFTEAFDVSPTEHPEWYDRDKRLATMDDQGLEAVWMFPSQGVVLEAPMLDTGDVEGTIEVIKAFNRWIDDDWGLAYQDRIFAAPYMTLSDPAGAAAELEWALRRGARIVHLQPGPVVTADGYRSAADPIYDRFWGLANEAGVVIASHGGLSSAYREIEAQLHWIYGELPPGQYPPPGAMNVMFGSRIGAMTKHRETHDFAFMLTAHRLFERHPRLRVAFVEHGSDWVPPLLRSLEYLDHSGAYKQNPREQFIEHCWVTPYPEDNLAELARVFPTDRILFGSDWPHGEGFTHPRDFFDIVDSFPDADLRRIMLENARQLTYARA